MSRICEECEYCIPMGSGDHLCDISNKLVIEDYTTTSDYMSCCGSDYIER